MNTHDELRGALRRRADEIDDGHPLGLDDVKGRARGIRRRRVAVSGLAAAAVVAIAVPVGISATSSTPGSQQRIEPAGPTPEQPVDPQPGATDLVLTTDRPVGGPEPGITLLDEGSIVPADGGPTPGGPFYVDAATFGDGWIALRNDGYDAALDVLDADGQVVGSYPAAGLDVALSEDGTVAAYSGPRGRVMTLAAGEEPLELYDGTGSYLPVAVNGSQTCDPESSPTGGCTVWGTEQNEPATFSVTSKGIVSDVPALLTLTSKSPDGRFAGAISFDDFSSCSAVTGPDGERAWETCDYGELTFSPDGRYVAGINADSDGAGSSTVAILDAETGDLVARVQNDRRTQAFSPQQAWDVDGTLLLTVFEKQRWALMRLSPDGDFQVVPDGEYTSKDPYVSDLLLGHP